MKASQKDLEGLKQFKVKRVADKIIAEPVGRGGRGFYKAKEAQDVEDKLTSGKSAGKVFVRNRVGGSFYQIH